MYFKNKIHLSLNISYYTTLTFLIFRVIDTNSVSQIKLFSNELLNGIMVIIELLNCKSAVNKVSISYSLVRPKLSDYGVKKVFSALYTKLTLLKKADFSVPPKAGGFY